MQLNSGWGSSWLDGTGEFRSKCINESFLRSRQCFLRRSADPGINAATCIMRGPVAKPLSGGGTPVLELRFKVRPWSSPNRHLAQSNEVWRMYGKSEFTMRSGYEFALASCTMSCSPALVKKYPKAAVLPEFAANAAPNACSFRWS